MWCDIYPLLDVLWWNLLGQWMVFLYKKVFPYVYAKYLLPKFNKGAPTWFTCGWAWWELWDYNLKDCATYRKKCIPNSAFALHFRNVAKDRLADWIKNAAKGLVDVLNDAIDLILGPLLHAYTSFSNWIESIRNIVGTYVPWWTTTLAAGLVWLRLRFPTAIRDATSSWDDIWDGIKAAVADWAKLRFDAAVAAGTDAWDWVFSTGEWLNNWWLGIREFLDDFFTFHVARVQEWLGDPWAFLAGAWPELRIFYNAVWVPFGVTLYEFLADPLLWIYDRIEDELIRQW